MSRSNSRSRAPDAELEADIADLAHDGRGVARIDGKAVFVAGALEGERVRLRLRQRHRHFDEAEVVEVLSASPHRVEPKCAHFGVCGGCSLQHLDAAAQIVAKQRVLADNFARIGKVEPASWLPPLVDEPWGYRRKGRLSVRAVAKKGRVLVGFREDANPRYVADIRHCDVVHPALGTRIEAISELVGSLDAAADIAQIEFAAGDDAIALVFRHLQPLSESDRAALVGFGRQHGFAIYLQPGGLSSVHPLWPESPRLAFKLSPGGGTDDVELEFRPL
ncbi:MAG: 23S rRNA (uracil(1939)-C(5))-methyltransferase, partial [Xanthomonadaceae bacterium]|nr:23S rRNA (uracil(1939)-C(5))-methyltransferase [Xanthomonadaceae bacterium]